MINGFGRMKASIIVHMPSNTNINGVRNPPKNDDMKHIIGNELFSTLSDKLICITIGFCEYLFCSMIINFQPIKSMIRKNPQHQYSMRISKTSF